MELHKETTLLKGIDQNRRHTQENHHHNLFWGEWTLSSLTAEEKTNSIFSFVGLVNTRTRLLEEPRRGF